jgi:curli biogenesis system outer membrane secretion channel CsgG
MRSRDKQESMMNAPTRHMTKNRAAAMRPNPYRSLAAWLCLVALALYWGAALGAEWGFKIRDTIEDTGAEVVKVYPATPAAGRLQAYDIIVEAAGHPVRRATDVYQAIGVEPRPGDRAVLRVSRGGARMPVTLEAAGGDAEETGPEYFDHADRSMSADLFGLSDGPTPPARKRATAPAPGAPEPAPQAAAPEAGVGEPVPQYLPPPTPPGQPVPQAMIMVGDLQAKAANATSAIGDGLREMLVTALHNSGRFIVVERMGLQALAAEQTLSRSRMAAPGMAIPEGRMDIAEVMVIGAVTEFEPEASGTGINLGITKLPFSFGRKTAKAHMAVDLRVVDVTSGRVLGAKRIKGEASASSTTVGISPRVSGGRIPISLGSFQNTPMEAAIRTSIEQSINFIMGAVPPQYFRVQ